MRILVECVDGSRALLEGEAAEKYLAKKREEGLKKDIDLADDINRVEYRDYKNRENKEAYNKAQQKVNKEMMNRVNTAKDGRDASAKVDRVAAGNGDTKSDRAAMDRSRTAINSVMKHERRHGSKNEGCCNESVDVFEGLDELFAD